MSREIKFRAWDGRRKIMAYDVDVYCSKYIDNKSWWFASYIDDNKVKHEFESLRCHKKDCALMQFTGLKDRNGEEIYEGDILEESPGYYFEVVWDGEWAKFKLQWRTKAYQYPEWNRGKEMTIIGNRFENPELLNGEDSIRGEL